MQSYTGLYQEQSRRMQCNSAYNRDEAPMDITNSGRRIRGMSSMEGDRMILEMLLPACGRYVIIAYCLNHAMAKGGFYLADM